MNDETRDDKLISPPPRDFLLGLRRDALEKKLISMSKQKAETARAVRDSLLKAFADNYFFDSQIYGALNLKEKNELAEICASSCRKSITLKSLPFIGIAGIVAGFGILNPLTLLISFFSLAILFVLFYLFSAVFGWLEDFIFGFLWDFRNCWKFLSARKLLKKLIGKNGIFSEESKTGA